MAKRNLRIERVQVAATLRRMRDDAGVSREEAADLLGCSPSKISDLEVGRSRPKLHELLALLDRYGVAGDERDELQEFARAAGSRRKRGTFSPLIPASFRRFLDTERQATSAVYYSGELLPGILQTEGYAHAVLSWGRNPEQEEFRKLLALRMERKQALTRTDPPPLRYWCVLAESALRTDVGGQEAMRKQLDHLLELSEEHEHVVIQVMPAGSGAHDLLGLSVTLYEFPTPAPRLLHLDSFGRGVFEDHEPLVDAAADKLDLVRAKALGPEESARLIASIAHHT